MNHEIKQFDVIVVGAGAAGLMAAIEAGKRGRNTLIIEHTNKIGEKIRISGGGRCNFTNLYTSPKNYLSNNSYFAISALTRYTQHDFIKLVESYNIAYHEKTLGQLFCDGSSLQIINMLVEECRKYGVTIFMECHINNINKNHHFELGTNQGKLKAESLVIATGGLSIPKIGASDFGYRIAEQFELNIIPTKPALVPLTVNTTDLEFCKSLTGIAISSIVSHDKVSFKENILFTHRGLSGPAILQISSYLNDPTSAEIDINLLPEIDISESFCHHRSSKKLLSNFLKDYLPNRFIEIWASNNITDRPLAECSNKEIAEIVEKLHRFKIKIAGTEGYFKAEVTTGGVDTKELSSKTMEAKKVSGLFFVGEVVDVTGWLGGYNFQWAWASGYVAGSYA